MHLVLIIWRPRGPLNLPKFIFFHHLYTLYWVLLQDLTAAEHEAEEKAKLEKVQALHLFKQKEKVDQAKKVRLCSFLFMNSLDCLHDLS